MKQSIMKATAQGNRARALQAAREIRISIAALQNKDSDYAEQQRSLLRSYMMVADIWSRLLEPDPTQTRIDAELRAAGWPKDGEAKDLG